tara:strand:- start:4513 stop:5286 length:774 start_codon:yes stop_codon:yes gene_type:complete
MECYSYKTINETNEPILKNADITIILIMENSSRFKHDPFLLNLSKKTVFQYNKGFKFCKKPSTIKMTNNDIIHAYYTAFEYAKNLNNVIILEEDAEVLYYTRRHYNIVDDYISKDFKIFSFSNYGTFTKLDKNFFNSSVICGAHANIISKPHRDYLMNEIEKNNFKGHIDCDYFKNDVVVYRLPLIVQLFPETENRKNWDTNKIISNFVIKILRLDRNKFSWKIVYKFCKIKRHFGNFLLAILLFLFIFYIAKNNKY